jgi:hypothetical protein
MPGALGPRFALEAGFLILLAVLLGFADLSPALIILIMALAWVLVSCIEYFAWRQGPRFPARYASATQSGPAYVEEEIVEERVPPPPAPAPPAEEQTIAAPAPAREAPEAGSAEETEAEADERIAEARLAFQAEERVRHRLQPLAPRPRRRWGLFGPRIRPDGESSREEER